MFRNQSKSAGRQERPFAVKIHNGPVLGASRLWIHQKQADIGVTGLRSLTQGTAVDRVRQGPKLKSSHIWIHEQLADICVPFFDSFFL